MQQTKYLIFLLLVFTMLTPISRCQTQECEEPNYSIPSYNIDQAFSQGINDVRSKDTLVQLIQDPNFENVKSYLLTLTPFFAPLFAMAGLTFVVFLFTILQVCCFNTCGKECCGNYITSSTYNVCCMKIMVSVFVFLSIVLVGTSIGGLIVNSDLQKAIDLTSCNSRNIINETYQGNNNETIPWSGIKSFSQQIQIFAGNIMNNVPYLSTYFNDNNAAFEAITNTSSTSSYSNTQVFPTLCSTSLIAIECPFVNASQCPSPYNPTFNQQFCNSSYSNSAANLIANEANVNSTTWKDNLLAIQTSLPQLTIDPSNVNLMTSDVSSFTDQLLNYENTLLDGYGQAENTNYGIEVALYVFYVILMILGFTGIIAVALICLKLKFSCKYAFYVLWYSYAVLGILYFLAAGFSLGASIFMYDSCTAYPYFFNNQTNFNTLKFKSDELQEILQTCFYTNASSMFLALTDQDILTEFRTLQEHYKLAVPPSNFSSVVSSIESTFNTYTYNPTTVPFFNISDSSQPSQAMEDFRVFANFSNPNTTQSCKNGTNDFVTFDIANCYPFQTNQNPPNDSCVVLSASNISTVLSNRRTTFQNLGCNTDADTYVNSANALIDFSSNITSMINQLSPIQPTTGIPIQVYQANYFTYFTQVNNFFTNEVKQVFSSIFDPYNALQHGSSCGYIVTSMNSIAELGCDQLFPYINLFSSLNIVISVFIFILFLLSYFLTVRFDFFEFLEGKFENFGEQTKSIGQIEKEAYEYNTNRQVELINNSDNPY